MPRERNGDKYYGTGYEDEPMSRFRGIASWTRYVASRILSLYTRIAWTAWFASVYTCCEDLGG
uniref:Uncharacterized protein n=1 Tax=Cryptococcus bacillisporus CA1280 TaxID=1296109 RepID=A0A0D0VI21_CRYGA|nr:hypothetical protein I312_06245 [Cryptococcus bacillisporus CA1280]